MTPTSLLSRAAAAAATATLLLTGTAACNASSADQPDAAASPAGAVTLTNKFGTVTLPASPARVVTIGFNEQDFAIALGVEPVGVREFLGYDSPNRPWLPTALQGKVIPTVGATELAFEKIAALQPDLILGVNSYIDAAAYAKLSAIAPTVAQTADYADGGTPWDQQTLLTGQVLGKQAQAEQLVSDVRARFDQVRSAHPEFAGRSASFLLGGDGASGYSLGTTDYRTGWLTELGFTVAAKDAELSLETLDAADSDVLMAESLSTSVTGSGVFKELAAVREHRYIDFGDYDEDFAAALGFNSPLSLPFVLQTAEPRLAAATDGDPATVPQAFPQ